MNYVIYQSNDFVVMGMISFNKSGWGKDFIEGIKFSSEDLPNNIFIDIEKMYKKDGNGELINIINKKNKYPNYFEIFNAPIISKDILDELNSQNIKGYDAYPVLLRSKNIIIADYFIINITNLVSCIDMSKTKCTFYHDKIARIQELHLDKARIPNLDIFRLEEQNLIIIISEKTKNILNNSNGICIDIAENWSDRVLF